MIFLYSWEELDSSPGEYLSPSVKEGLRRTTLLGRVVVIRTARLSSTAAPKNDPLG